MRHLEQWSQRVRKFAADDTALATAVCEARRLVAGYSDTHSRGESKFDKVMQASERLDGLELQEANGRIFLAEGEVGEFAARVVVALGDSITDSQGSTVDSNTTTITDSGNSQPMK